MIIDTNGTKFWYQDGKLHREDGPAIEFANGTRFWFLDGKLHREDGPACEFVDGLKFWFLDGKQVSKKAFLVWSARRLDKHLVTDRGMEEV